MQILIKTNSLSGLRPVFTDELENYKRYIQIRKKFENNNFYRIFAEPKLDNFRKEVSWFTNWNGTISTFNTYLSNTPNLTKEELEAAVKTEINKVFNECIKFKDTDAEYESLYNTLNQCIEVPDHEDIHVVTLANGEQHFILTNWGFIKDSFNAATGIIQKMKLLNLINLQLKFKYTNGDIAAGEKIYAEYSSQKLELITDNNGVAIINRYPLDSSLSTYQLENNGNKININNIPVVNSEVLDITIRNFNITDLLFHIRDEQNNIQKEKEIIFRINNTEIRKSSNNDGKILLKDVPLNANIDCNYIESDKICNLKSLICSNSETEHNLTIPFTQAEITQKGKNIVLHFIDKKKNNLTGLNVITEQPAGIKNTYTTDNDGKFSINNTVPGTKIKLSAQKDKLKWKTSFKTKADTFYYLFIVKKKSKWWLWLLLALLLILALIIAGFLIKNYLYQKKYDEIINRISTTEVIVIDDATDKPVPNATVKLSCKGYSKEQVTTATGTLTFTGMPIIMPANPLVVYAIASGYGDERLEYTFYREKITVRMKKLDNGGLVGRRGEFNVNLSWKTQDDLDLLVEDICGDLVYFKTKKRKCKGFTGELDVDANYDDKELTSIPQENIVWDKAPSGNYKVYVLFYKKREKYTTDYTLTIISGGKKEIIKDKITYDGTKKPVLIKTITL